VNVVAGSIEIAVPTQHKTADQHARDRSAGWAMAMAIGIAIVIVVGLGLMRLRRRVVEERVERQLEEQFNVLERRARSVEGARPCGHL